jgi:hypothetical protein
MDNVRMEAQAVRSVASAFCSARLGMVCPFDPCMRKASQMPSE